jgi:hypothetical protein
MVENKPWAASLEENSTMTTWLKDELRSSTAWRLNSSPYLRAILLFFTVAFILL